MERTGRLSIMIISMLGLLLSGSTSLARNSSTKAKSSSSLQAQNSSSTQAQASLATSATPAPQTEKEKPWALALSVSRSNSLYVTGDGNDQASWDFGISPSFKLSPDYSLAFIVEYSQDLKADETDFGRGSIALAKTTGFDLFNKRANLVPRVSVGTPLSEASKASSLYASTGVGFALNANPDYLISKKLALSLGVSGTRNFHKYDSAVNGKINTQWSTSQSVDIGWSFTDDLSFTVSGGHYSLFSYQGAQAEALSHTEEIGLKLSPKWAVAVGHQYGAPYVAARRANGRDINFDMTDEQNSMVYAQLNLTL